MMHVKLSVSVTVRVFTIVPIGDVSGKLLVAGKTVKLGGVLGVRFTVSVAVDVSGMAFVHTMTTV